MDPQDMVPEERARLHSHWGGRASALEAAAVEASQEAGSHFARGQEEKARWWRDVADWLRKRAAAERRKQSEFA